MTYDVRQLVERYEVTQTTVLHWIASGQLRAINVGVDPGKQKPRWRITEEALREFELARSTSPPPTPSPRKRRKATTATTDVVFYK